METSITEARERVLIALTASMAEVALQPLKRHPADKLIMLAEKVRRVAGDPSP